MQPKEPSEFVNTWSVDGFVSEGSQPASSAGDRMKNWPRDGKKHDFGRGSAIYLMQPGAGTACARGHHWPATSTAS
jgi:homospermidine synthase